MVMSHVKWVPWQSADDQVGSPAEQHRHTDYGQRKVGGKTSTMELPEDADRRQVRRRADEQERQGRPW